MKRFTEHIKESINAINPGNQLLKTGVTNHYTPIQNILTNINNLFCSILGIVATVGEDNVSIKLASSQFTSQDKINELLWRPLYNDAFGYGTNSLQGYISAQGLPKVTTINLGASYVVYFCSDDIATAQDPIKMSVCPIEANECLYDEFELGRIYENAAKNSDEDQNNDSNDDNNNNSQNNDNIDGATHKEEQKSNDISIEDILKNEDKVKATKQLEILISQKLNLPREFYFAVVKFKNDDEAIALRWKYDKKLPTGKSTENTRSLMHIFTAYNKIWVQDFAKDSIVKLPTEIQTLINNILEFLKAKKTNEPDVFELGSGSSDNNEDNDKDQTDNNDINNNN